MYKINFETPIHVHFIGIGGISMSGLAEILLKEGFTISGSDNKESALTDHLEQMGAKVFYGQKASNIIPGIDVVVYTAAIHPDNEEYAEAVRQGLPMLTRAEKMVYTAAGTGKGTGSSGSDPQPGSSSGYYGDYEGTCERTKRCDPLLFLFQRNGTGIYQDGILHRHWRSGNIQKCEEAERSSRKYSADIYCTRDGLPVHGTGTESWKAQQFCLYPLCGREDCRIKRHYI